MSESRCNCTRPNTRGKGRACPIHKTIPEDSIIELRNPVRESTPNTEEDESGEEEPFPINFEVMDELLTQLAADRQATNTRMETLLKDNRKVRLKEPKEFKGEENYDINDFLNQFDKFCEFNGVAAENKSVLFSSFLGPEPARFYNGLEAGVRNNFDTVKDRFTTEYNPVNHKFYKRQQLNRRKKKDSEQSKMKQRN